MSQFVLLYSIVHLYYMYTSLHVMISTAEPALCLHILYNFQQGTVFKHLFTVACRV